LPIASGRELHRVGGKLLIKSIDLLPWEFELNSSPDPPALQVVSTRW